MPLIKTKHNRNEPETMKKKLTLLIFLFPLVIMAQQVNNGRVQSDSTQQQSNQDDEGQQKPKKQRKANTDATADAQGDWKRNGLFKALFHVGLNACQIDGDNYNGYDQFGLNAGVGALVRFHKYLSVSMSIDYSMEGARQQLKNDPNNTTPEKYQVQWDYIQVPLMLNVHDKNIVMFGVGLQPAVMVRYQEWDSYGANITNATPPPPGGTPHVFDLDGVAALHFLVLKKIMLGAKFSYSLIPVRGSEPTNKLKGEYNNVLTFEVGYLLDTVKKRR
jgi:hypothetical protein